MITFQHRVDKLQIPVHNILGINIAAINMDWLLDFTDKHIEELSGDYMCVSNVHTTVISFEDRSYFGIQNSSIMVILDGMPLSTVGQKCGFKNVKCTMGLSYMEEILKISAQKG